VNKVLKIENKKELNKYTLIAAS